MNFVAPSLWLKRIPGIGIQLGQLKGQTSLGEIPKTRRKQRLKNPSDCWMLVKVNGGFTWFRWKNTYKNRIKQGSCSFNNMYIYDVYKINNFSNHCLFSLFKSTYHFPHLSVGSRAPFFSAPCASLVHFVVAGRPWFRGVFCVGSDHANIPSLKLTAKALKKGRLPQKESSLPTIHFQVLC